LSDESCYCSIPSTSLKGSCLSNETEILKNVGRGVKCLHSTLPVSSPFYATCVPKISRNVMSTGVGITQQSLNYFTPRVKLPLPINYSMASLFSFDMDFHHLLILLFSKFLILNSNTYKKIQSNQIMKYRFLILPTSFGGKGPYLRR
jgi:hypothetical protein